MTCIADRPGRALVDLSETLRTELPLELVEGGDEIIFLPREIKGLERATVLIYGLDRLYRRALG